MLLPNQHTVTSQVGAAIPAWTHNPKVVFDPIEQMWVMYHIGDGTTHRPLQNCTSTLRQHARPHQVDAESKASSAAPFALHFSPSLDGPWKSLPSSGVGTGENNRAGAGPSLTTIYPGVSNVDAPAATPVPSGSVKLYEQPEHGNGTLTLSFSSFLRVSSYLAWDACGGATFDNGHAVEAANVGSRIGSFEVRIAFISWCLRAVWHALHTFRWIGSCRTARSPLHSRP